MREDWTECSLIEGCDIHDNLRKPINSKERNERINGKTQDQLFPYYGATGQVGYIDDYLTDGDFVLIGEDAAPFLDYSKDVAYQISGKTWVNNHAHILKSKFNDMFLLHFLNNFNYKDYVSGTTRLKLTQGRLKQIPIKIAPLPEQRAIVAKIEELFSDLGKGIADLKKAQDQLKIYRQAVLKKAFEKLTNETTLEEIKEDSLIGLVRASGLQNNIGEGTAYLKMDKIDMIGNINLEGLVYVETNEEEIEKYSLKTGDILLNTRNSYELVGKTGVIRNIKETVVFNNNIK
jgi:type I restriction enzyme, S subunit